MRTQTVEFKIFKFMELSKEAKEKAKQDYYDVIDYPFLQEELQDWCAELLDKKKIKHENLKLYYSLSNCQGDGLCFIGDFKWGKYFIKITSPTSHYMHKNSTIIDITYIKRDEEVYASEVVEKAFKKIYDAICDKLEKVGYDELEYRMTDEEFADHCEMNQYEFNEDGTRSKY
jgi:hypothetical protein